jgi:hypothetical protein
MTLTRVAYLCFSAATTAAALVAARYWYVSSRPTPDATLPPIASVSDNPQARILGTQVDIGKIHSSLYEAARLNKKAAAWSAVAAFLGALTSVIPLG